MERISFNKTEKAVYREIADHPIKNNTEKSTEYIEALYSLKRMNFAEVSTLKGKIVMEAYLTEEGRSYINAHPKLRGPILWDRIIAIGAIIVAIIVALTSCLKLMAANLL